MADNSDPKSRRRPWEKELSKTAAIMVKVEDGQRLRQTVNISLVKGLVAKGWKRVG